MKPGPALTFAIHATSRGFGFVVFEGPFILHYWGTVVAKAKGDKNEVCLRKLEPLLEEFKPEALILEAAGKGNSLRSERIAILYRAITAMASDRGIPVHVYPFKDVKACFRDAGAAQRQEIAEAVARSVEALSDLVPKRREAWDGDHRRMPVFCAAALVLTHFQAGNDRLLEDILSGS